MYNISYYFTLVLLNKYKYMFKLIRDRTSSKTLLMGGNVFI